MKKNTLMSVLTIDKSIETIIATRKLLIQLVEELSGEEINVIPPGFNNNIAWNLGHVVATQQVLFYRLSGLPLLLPDALVAKYAKGSKPEAMIAATEIIYLKEAAVTLMQQLIIDLEKNAFTGFKPYATSFGVQLNNIQEVIKYITMHEGLHLGYAMAMKRVLQSASLLQ